MPSPRGKRGNRFPAGICRMRWKVPFFHPQRQSKEVEPPHQSPAAKISEQSEEMFLTDFPSRGSLWSALDACHRHAFSALSPFSSPEAEGARAGAQGSLPSFLRKKAGGSGDAAADEVEFRKGAAGHAVQEALVPPGEELFLPAGMEHFGKLQDFQQVPVLYGFVV